MSLCPECGGTGELGRARCGRLIACETCGGDEDRLGRGVVEEPTPAPAEPKLPGTVEYREVMNGCWVYHHTGGRACAINPSGWTSDELRRIADDMDLRTIKPATGGEASDHG